MIEAIGNHDPRSAAIINAQTGKTVTYGDLAAKIKAAADCLGALAGRPFVFLYMSNSVDAIAAYLACLKPGLPVCLLESVNSAKTNVRILEAYRPPVILLPGGESPPPNYCFYQRLPENSYEIYKLRDHFTVVPHREVALLLPTSGSTGNPKLARLSYRNVLANARSIVEYLDLFPGERSIQSLPIHYSYGLSLVNSHLLSGGTIVLTPYSFIRREFWKDFDTHSCTSFAGVPYIYETLHRLRFNPSDHPTLRTITQAGGHLRPDLIESFHQMSIKAGVRFFVMYGQTEAAARISYVPPEILGEKIGSIGCSIPGGRMELAGADNSENIRELVYSGPNVMLGYAESASSLELGDELSGVLHTGDLARVDEDGFFYICGRLKRFVKLFGRRVNLQDIESGIETEFPVRAASMDKDDHLTVFVELLQDTDVSKISQHLADQLSVTLKAITINQVDSIPLTSSGKKDYKSLHS